MPGADNESDRYERAIAELHTVANDLAEIDSQTDICRRTIDAAENLLEFDLSILAIEDGGRLHPKAVSSGLSSDEFESMSTQEGIAGKTYRTGEKYLIDDLSEWEESNSKGEWVSGISLPVGSHGNFQAVETEAGAFDERDLQLADLLVTHTANHLSRLENRWELERQNDCLDEFASIVSHDLRNPLNVASLRLELAREDCENEHLDEVEGAHRRMEGLIDDLLTLAREGDTTCSTVDLSALVTDCWRNVVTGDLRLVAEGERHIVADERQLKQLLENLFRNSVEHGSANGRSLASDAVEHAGGTVVVGELADGFYIEDDGSGIPEDEREAVFGAGYSTSQDGTGMGLRIVKQIADAHDWDIRITESTTGGTRLEITGVTFAEG